MVVALRLLLLSVGLAVALAACAEAPSEKKEPAYGQPMLLETDPAALVAETPRGPVRITVEVADEGAEHSAGLMFRETMGDLHGMLFVFDVTRARSFWMMNTVMALDIIYIREDGSVANIVQGTPFSPDPLDSAGPVRYVLELKAGTAAALALHRASGWFIRELRPASDRAPEGSCIISITTASTSPSLIMAMASLCC